MSKKNAPKPAAPTAPNAPENSEPMVEGQTGWHEETGHREFSPEHRDAEFKRNLPR